MFKLTNIAIILFVTTAINAVVFSISWQRRKAKSGLYFALGMIGITLWTMAAGLGYAAVPLSLKILFAKIDAVGYFSALSFFVLCGLHFAGFDEWAEKTWIKALLILLPALCVLLIATNELHGWVWQGFLPVENNVVVFEHGPGFVWLAAVGYLMIASLIGTLWLASRKGSEISRRQNRLLLYAIIFPIIANLVYLYGVKGTEGVDWSSVTFSISGFLFLRALYGAHLLDITPIARDKLVANLSDGMIVLDVQNRIIDINRAAADMLQSESKALIGKSLTEVAPLPRSILDQPPEQEIKTELRTGGADKRYFDLLISPLRERQHKIIGRLIIIRDITTRKENELRLLQLTTELQEAQAQVVEQHRTLAKLEERQRMGRDMHDSVNQSIYSMMMLSETLGTLLRQDHIEKSIELTEQIQESGMQALKEIRALLYQTQSLQSAQNADFLNVLEQRLNMVERRTGIKAEIICEGDFDEYCPEEWKDDLYWIIIEALNNSLKYARARHISIYIKCARERLTVEVKDDGAGFDRDQVGGGFGMQSMRERAEILGGELQVQSASGSGTNVFFHASIRG